MSNETAASSATACVEQAPCLPRKLYQARRSPVGAVRHSAQLPSGAQRRQFGSSRHCRRGSHGWEGREWAGGCCVKRVLQTGQGQDARLSTDGRAGRARVSWERRRQRPSARHHMRKRLSGRRGRRTGALGTQVPFDDSA